MYKPVDARVSFPKMEEAILAFWNENDVFERSVTNRDGRDEFVFYDGPPFATGLPHYGHILAGTIKDIIPRYQTMKGRKVERRFGWDCHGLPVEYEMEKELGLSGKSQIDEYGVANFNEACRGIVLRYTAEWRQVVTRMGRWVDFDNDYKTMDLDYMESIWWVFKQLWDRGYVYEGFYILPYSPALATPLSNFEVNLGGYHDVTDPAITVRFELADEPGTSILAWTTTPWTLPSNLGLAMGPDIDYVKIAVGDEHVILAKSRLDAYYPDAAAYTIDWTKKGRDLAGLHYRPLFPYFAALDADGAFRTHVADYVTTEDGTGIVHIAPGFGEDDYNVLKGSGLPVPVPIDAECRFTSEVPDFEGLFVKDADKPIIARLKEEGRLVKRENYLHPYPFCYRTQKPLIYRAVSSWFVNIDKVKASMLAANAEIAWMPPHLKEGRFGKWLEGARDWAISRNRFWGNPIPIWKCDGSDYVECIGSIEELERKSGAKVTDLHKHYVDELTWPSPDGKGTMRRVPEVLDCWFESGAMPYAQNHYPFENKEWFDAHYPAEFIAEGLDQTRGWFYTLTVLAAALFDKPAFKNVIVNGIVLAEDGKKMSKSLRNYTPPTDVIDQFGADALRLSLMYSNVVKAEDMKYSDDTVRDVLKTVIIPLWNSYSFFVTYANIDRVTPTHAPDSPQNPLDRWILSEAERLVEEVTVQFDGYDLQRAIDPIVNFIDLLNNWYIRRSRRRFWRSENDADKHEAYGTLYSVLLTLVKVAAPIIPFMTDEIYRNLTGQADNGSDRSAGGADVPISVHLCDFPVADRSRRDYDLEQKMAVTKHAVSMGRAIRSMHNLKIRQPLMAIHLVTRDATERRILIEMEDFIRDELNVKEVVFRENEEELVEYSAKANFRKLGRELGPAMREAAAKIESLSAAEIHGLIEGTTLSIDVAGRALDLSADDVIVQRSEKENLKVLNEGSLTVALDPEITEDLRHEGYVRDLIRHVQNVRKESGLDVTDRIRLTLAGSAEVRAAVDANEEYLMGETLSVSLDWSDDARGVDVAVGEGRCSISVAKAD
ncbi:MAG: isoleucine--tRNA ligase [Spirochaetaceae bacterium]|nr:MAG: isoleucine--tRNA ligase [Spirochaetaceae bacterium]